MVTQGVSIKLQELAVETGWLRRLARSLVQDAAAAEDLVHDTYVVAAERAPSDGRPLRPWLVRVMTNLVRMQHRGARRRETRERAASELMPRPAKGDELVEQLEMHRLLASLVLKLDRPARELVLLVYGEGLTSQQVGERLGIAAGTVRWRLKLALDELRDQLSSHQPRRVWTKALAGFAGMPRRAAGVGVPVLIAAAILLVLVAGWLAVHVRSTPDARAGATWPTPRTDASAGRSAARELDVTRKETASPELPSPPGRRRIVGRVVDDQQRPVADADVAVTCGVYPIGDVYDEGLRARTTQSGGFSVEVDSTCQVSITAHRDGRSAMGYRVERDDGSRIVLTLLPDIIVTVHVVDADTNAPLPGARIVSLHEFAPTPSGPGTSDKAGVAKISLHAPHRDSPDGVPNSTTLLVEATGHVPEVITVATTNGELRAGPLERTVHLARGLPISGQLVGPDGEAVPHAALHIRGPRGQESEALTSGSHVEHADDAGHFEVRVPRAGTYELTARTASLEPADRGQGVVAIGDRGGRDVVIHLVPRQESGVTGEAVDLRGEPVAGARISSPSQFIKPVTSDDKGRFTIPRAREAFHLLARAGEMASEVVAVRPQAGVIAHLKLTLGPAGATGIVVDADGAPIAKAQLWVNHDSLSSWGYSLAGRYFTDEHGAFSLDLPRGAFRVSVRRSFEDDFLDQDDVVLSGGTRAARIVLP
jgi:RNA polymerase sigma-70 factor (ECF subfamily)